MRFTTLRAVLLASTLAFSGVTATVVTAPAAHADDPTEVAVTSEPSPLPGLPVELPRVNLSTISECGGTAPVTTTCSRFGLTPLGTFYVGCASSLAFSGYINVSFSTATGSMTFTCYWAGGTYVTKSTPQVTGHFIEKQVFTLRGTGIGTGGWLVRVRH